MNDVLPSAPEESAAVPVSSIAVVGGVLVAYGAFAVLISIVAAFANGAHSHQVLSGATWKQLGTGGGIVAGIALFIAWATGGFFAARMAGREGLRHGVWVFIVGVVLITVVGAAITWLPDTTAILRNLRLLGLPLRRNEWRDVGTVAGVASLVGMAAGAFVGGWFALRQPTPRPARVRAPEPAVAPPLPPEPATKEEVPEPAFTGPSLFDQPTPSPAGASDAEPATPAEEATPAWLQFVQERERGFERERESAAHNEPVARPEPAPWTSDEPPIFIEEPEQVEPQPAEPTSWWPDQSESQTEADVERDVEPAPSFDNAWALPDDQGAAGVEGPEGPAFPHSAPTPVPEAAPEAEPEAAVSPPPLDEHADWQDDEPFRAPPEAVGEDALQHAPEAPPPEPELDPTEREERRRQQEEAARAYEQAREDQ